MKATKALSLLLLVAPAWCSTKVLMHNVASPVTGYRYATKTQGRVRSHLCKQHEGADEWRPIDGDSGRTGASLDFATACGGHDYFGTVDEYLGVGAECLSLRHATNPSRNTREWRRRFGLSHVCTLAPELTTSITQQNWTATPTSTSFAVGDRIVVVVFCGSKMPSGTMNGTRV